MTVKREDFLNRQLALLLREQGLSTDYEQQAGRRRMDVVARVNGVRVVLEAETGFHRRAQAVKDADARLRQGLTVAVFAVCYPAKTTEENLADAIMTWTLRTDPDAPVGEWSTGDVANLAGAVRQSLNSVPGVDVAAQILSDALDVAVGQIGEDEQRRLARALDLPDDRSQVGQKGKEARGSYRVAAKRGMLVVAAAMLFHSRLHGHLPILRPAGYDGPWPTASPTQCIDQPATAGAFQEAWRGIWAVDYRPVFQTGLAALAELADRPDSSLAVRMLAIAVVDIAQQVAGIRHDLLGRIFHRVLDTARYDGSFYTSTAAAVLLSALALRQQDADWNDVAAVSKLRICDPACGTGTLLMAAAERIRDLWNAGGGEQTPELDQALVESMLWGYDSNLTATHMAATTLGMMTPSVRFEKMNIHRVRFGVFEGEPYVGSLEFLAGQARLVSWPTLAQQVESDKASELRSDSDLLIMNPPFTRDSLRYDQFQTDEKTVKDREMAIVAGLPDPAAARLSGNANAFIVLGEKMQKTSDGTLAMVLPTAIATNPAALHTRRYLAEKYHVDTIVVSHDPERIFFSENTSIGEMLVICRRKGRGGTRVVKLARNPATPVAALDVAARIEGGGLDGGIDFVSEEIPRSLIKAGDWSAVNFLSPFLTGAYRALMDGDATEPPVVPLRQLADVGPEGRRIRDAYTRQQMPTALGRRALWHHKTDVTVSMASEPDSYIVPKRGKEKLADGYWDQRSAMLLPHRLWLPLARVAAATLGEQVVGSAWSPCRAHRPESAKALCLYLNSTPGLLSLLGGRDNRKPSYPNFSLDTLRSVPVPDLDGLGGGALDHMVAQFEWIKGDTLSPFPDMARDPVRHQIDGAVAEALGMDAEWVSNVRREMAREPSITDRRIALD